MMDRETKRERIQGAHPLGRNDELLRVDESGSRRRVSRAGTPGSIIALSHLPRRVSTMRRSLLIGSAGLLMLTAVQAQTPQELRGPGSFAGISDTQARSRALFSAAAPVLTH